MRTNNFNSFGLMLKITSALMVIELVQACNEKLLPDLSTANITDITYNSAVCQGYIPNSGKVTKAGFCISDKNQNPDTVDTKVIVENISGTFRATVSGLIRNTKYYMRPYAITEEGIGYGEVREFMTLGDPLVSEVFITHNFYSGTLSEQYEYGYDAENRISWRNLKGHLNNLDFSYKERFNELRIELDNINDIWLRSLKTGDIFRISSESHDTVLTYSHNYDTLNLVSSFNYLFGSGTYYKLYHEKSGHLVKTESSYNSYPETIEIEYENEKLLPKLEIECLIVSWNFLYSGLFYGESISRQIKTVNWTYLNGGEVTKVCYNYAYEFNNRNYPVKIKISNNQGRAPIEIQIKYIIR